MSQIKNGFRLPLHPFQITSWLIQVFNISLTLSILIAMFDEYILFLFSVYIFFQIGLLILGYLATKSDPSFIQKNSEDLDYLEYKFYCSDCQQGVRETTKHCGSCQRCVDNFDHHCKLLNNCIGGKNYKLFVYLIIEAEFLEAVLVALLLFVLFQLDLNSYDSILLGTAVILNLLINGVLLSLNTYLIAFHIYLKLIGLTTYEFITKVRNTNKKQGKPTSISRVAPGISSSTEKGDLKILMNSTSNKIK